MPTTSTFAYLAGAMDSDGYFTIKKSTYHRRVRGDAVNAVYSEKIGLHQVTPHIPDLLCEMFGGYSYLAPPQKENGRPMYRWDITDTNAAEACRQLLPYLRVKRTQAETLLELRESKDRKYVQCAYWFALEYPNWYELPLVTLPEANEMLGYTGWGVTQAIRHGTLLALPYDHRGIKPRIPRLLVERVLAHQTPRGHIRLPDELIAWKERLWQTVRRLNMMGVNGTPIFHRTGYYAPAE